MGEHSIDDAMLAGIELARAKIAVHAGKHIRRRIHVKRWSPFGGRIPLLSCRYGDQSRRDSARRRPTTGVEDEIIVVVVVVVVDQPHKMIVLIETISDLYGPAGPHPNNCPILTGFLATLHFLDTSEV